MAYGNRRTYPRNWLRRRWVQELIIVGWLAACGAATTRFNVSAEIAVWAFVGGAAVVALTGPITHMVRRRTPNHKAPVKPLGSRRGYVVLVGTVMVVAFGAVMLWPSSDQFRTQSPPVMSEALEPASFPCRVASVHDGDTLRCADGTRIRLHAVAAREIDGTCSPGHPCPSASAEAARATLVRLTANRTITCFPTGQSYNRVTAICSTPGGVEINCAMVQSGTTVVWDRFNRETPICRS